MRHHAQGQHAEERVRGRVHAAVDPSLLCSTIAFTGHLCWP